MRQIPLYVDVGNAWYLLTIEKEEGHIEATSWECSTGEPTNERSFLDAYEDHFGRSFDLDAEWANLVDEWACEQFASMGAM